MLARGLREGGLEHLCSVNFFLFLLCRHVTLRTKSDRGRDASRQTDRALCRHKGSVAAHSRSLTLLHMNSGAQPWPSPAWLQSVRLRCGGEAGGVAVCVPVCVFQSPPPSSLTTAFGPKLWRVLMSECSPWRPCQWVLVPTSGL